jgi:hypothetical protein
LEPELEPELGPELEPELGPETENNESEGSNYQETSIDSKAIDYLKKPEEMQDEV